MGLSPLGLFLMGHLVWRSLAGDHLVPSDANMIIHKDTLSPECTWQVVCACTWEVSGLDGAWLSYAHAAPAWQEALPLVSKGDKTLCTL